MPRPLLNKGGNKVRKTRGVDSLMPVGRKTWSRYKGTWFLWKLSVEGDMVKETWQTKNQVPPQGPDPARPGSTWTPFSFKKSWPMHSPGWAQLEIRVTPDEVTEVWDRELEPALEALPAYSSMPE